MTDSSEMTVDKFDFNFERASLQDTVSAYKDLYNRKVCKAKQLSLLLYFMTSTADFNIEAGRQIRRCKH